MHTYVLILISLIANGLTGLSGGLLSDRWLKRHQFGLIAFACGALLGAVFLDVLPETIHDYGLKSLNWTLVGFVLILILNSFALPHDHQAHKHSLVLPATLLFSDALHNISDGAAIAAAFLISHQAGAIVTIAVIAHEVPQEVGDYALLRASGWNRGRSVLALAGVQLTAGIGALGLVLFAAQFQQVTAIVLSMAGGSFLYIGATNLLPEICVDLNQNRAEKILAFLGGIGIVALVSVIAAG